jgi:hypothetical protein
MSGDLESSGRPGGDPGDPRLRIFLNYRREDTRPYARLLYDALRERWPGDDQVFLDLDRISAGLDFGKAINRAVSRCDVLIAVIGSKWLAVADPQTGEKRLEDRDDYVRLEIEAALVRDVRVIPVLVGGAAMPPSRDLPQSLVPLTRRHALELTDTHWDYDVERLLDALSRIEREKTPSLPRESVGTAAGDGGSARPVAAEAGAEAAGARPAPGSIAVETPPAARQRRPRMRTRWLVAALLVAIAAAAAIVAAIVLTGGDGGEPAAGERVPAATHGVAGVIPTVVFRHSCRAASAPLLAGGVESVVCTPPSSSATPRLPLYPSRWEATTFRSAAAMTTAYDALRRRHDIGGDFGRCDGASWGGEGVWTHGPGKPGGRRFCYFEGNVAVVVWTHGKLGQASHIDMIGVAREGGSDHATLFSWWRFWHHRIGKCQQQGCTARV